VVVSGDSRNLVREFFAGVYVFQSFLVACALRVFGGLVPLVLESDARATHENPVGGAGTARGLDDRQLLSERDGASRSPDGITALLLARLEGSRPGHCRGGAASAFKYPLPVCHRSRAAPHVRYAPGPLRKPLQDRIWVEHMELDPSGALAGASVKDLARNERGEQRDS